MRYRHKIRFRILLSYSVLGLLISLFTVLFLLFSFKTLEQQFLDNYLHEELEHFISLTEEIPNLEQQKSKSWVVYKVDKNIKPKHLSFLLDYPEGTREIEHAGKFYHLGVIKRDDWNYYILYDETALEQRELNLMTFLIVCSVTIVLLATWYGFSLSKKVIEPITSLATRIKTLDETTGTPYLAQDYADDEVGALALEFDAYRQRLQSLVRRERDFTGNASHELRTPLAVITVSSESLYLNPALPQNLKQKVQRIRRSADEMAARLDVLLTLAREQQPGQKSAENTNILAVIEQLVEDHHDLLKPDVSVSYTINASPNVNAPYAIVAMLVGNFIKNAFANTCAGSVHFILNDSRVSIEDTGKGIPAEDLDRIFERGYRGETSQGSGFGLEISKRICEYYGWQLAMSSQLHIGTRIDWGFSTSQ